MPESCMLEPKFREHVEKEIDRLLPAIAIAGSDRAEDKKLWGYEHFFDFSYGFGIGMMLGAIMLMFETYYKRPASKDEIADAVDLIKYRASKIKRDLKKL